MERVNEMKYANREDAFQRQAANLAIRQRIEGAHDGNRAGNNGENDEVPIPPAQNNGNLVFLLEQEQQELEQEEHEQEQ